MSSLDPEMIAVLAKKTPAERSRTAWAMWRSARKMITRILQAENPTWTQEQIQAEVNRRMSHGA
ncbi:MAG: hypothetical protein AAF497_12835 [Planctomycetota bacterium]